MSTLEEILVSIINDAITAPSGENAQPWKFAIEGNSIHVYNLPRRTPGTYRAASFLTHGALLEIISISASHYGYQVETKLFPDHTNPNFIAIATLEKQTSKKMISTTTSTTVAPIEMNTPVCQ